jgi:hypothetical protein
MADKDCLCLWTLSVSPAAAFLHTNWVGFRENLPERLDRLIGELRMPPSSPFPIASPD